MSNTTETVFDFHGNKCGIVCKEGSEVVAYNLSDLEVYRGDSWLEAAWVLQGRDR